MYPWILTCCGGVGVSKVRIHEKDGIILPSLFLVGMFAASVTPWFFRSVMISSFVLPFKS